MFPPGLISSFLLKTYLKLHFKKILKYVGFAALGVAPERRANAGHPTRLAIKCTLSHLWAERKKKIAEGRFFFDILRIKRDAGYLCWDVAAKSLSPCGTKQGFVVGFERAV